MVKEFYMFLFSPSPSPPFPSFPFPQPLFPQGERRLFINHCRPEIGRHLFSKQRFQQSKDSSLCFSPSLIKKLLEVGPSNHNNDPL